jgi:hypothetical protein
LLRNFFSIANDGERQSVRVTWSALSFLHRFNFMPVNFLCDKIFKVAHYRISENKRRTEGNAVPLLPFHR